MALVLNRENEINSPWIIYPNSFIEDPFSPNFFVDSLYQSRENSPHSINNDTNNDITSEDASSNSKVDVKGYEDEPLSLTAYNANYAFSLPSPMVGKLIGKGGRVIKWLKKSTHCQIYVTMHPLQEELNVIVIEGLNEDIKSALVKIRDIFPLDLFPQVTLTNIDEEMILQSFPLYHLIFPSNFYVNVHVSHVLSAGHIFLQQLDNILYSEFQFMQQNMTLFYDSQLLEFATNLNSNILDSFKLHNPNTGYLCAGKIHNVWYRCQIMELLEEDDYCLVKLLDFGGTTKLHLHDLKKLELEFLNLPVMATECYMSNIIPLEGKSVFSVEACNTLESMVNVQDLSTNLFLQNQQVSSKPLTISNHPSSLEEEEAAAEPGKWFQDDILSSSSSLTLYAKIDRYAVSDGIPFVTLFYYHHQSLPDLSTISPSISLVLTSPPQPNFTNQTTQSNVFYEPPPITELSANLMDLNLSSQDDDNLTAFNNNLIPFQYNETFKEQDLLSVNQMLVDLNLASWTDDIIF